jgi:hypothetical protein
VETLAIIGMTQIVLLPVIAARRRFAFSPFRIVRGTSSWRTVQLGFRARLSRQLDGALGNGNRPELDGGFFGALTWGIAMLGGTITFDIMRYNSDSKCAASAACLGSA